MNKNICLMSDSYKMGHYNMYPDGTTKVYSYFESRDGAMFDETVFFGLQYLLKEYLVGQVVTRKKIDEAEMYINAHLGLGIFNRKGWKYILDKYQGWLPVRIKAVDEGTVVPVSNVMMTVENLDPKCFWLTNYLETLLTHVWSSSTVATLSREIKKMLTGYFIQTSDSMDLLDFYLHDFGYRGVSSYESAGIGGAGHLVNFKGTDTIAAIQCTVDYYSADLKTCAFSVPATEHSIMTSLGKDQDIEILGQLLDKYSSGLLSVVIDSYDYREFIKEAAKRYKDKILNREGKVVFRPDSGDPVTVSREVFELLYDKFGGSINSKGFRVLVPQVGMLWGDGIGIEDIRSILGDFMVHGISAENIVFGMGSGLLQKINRDMQRFAFKCSYQERNGKGYDIFKDPIDKSKMSKRGRFDDNKSLKTVMEYGYLLNEQYFEDIRERARI